jgi:hypothetical protein
VKRIAGNGIDRVTVAHKLVGLVWFVSAAAALVLVMLLPRSGAGSAGAWSRIEMIQLVAAGASVAMLVVSLVYAVATAWGFGILRHRILLAKWALFLVATGFGGPGTSAGQARSVSGVIGLTLAELLCLVFAAIIGVRLERARHSGRVSGL